MPDLDDALLRELLDLAYDHACARPFGELVDVGRVLPALDRLAEPERVARWQKRLFIPLRERWIERASKSEALMGAWLPPAVTAKLREALGRPAPIPRKWVDEAVGSERVRDAVRAMLSESLTSFVQKASSTLTENKAAGSGGLRGALGWGAKAAGTVLGGIGEEVQSRLQDRVRDYVDVAVATVQGRISERLLSEETAKAIGKRRLAAFEKFLKTPESQAAKSTRKTPWADIDALAPSVVAHNLAREEVRAAVVADLEAALKELSGETLGSLLDDAGLREEVRAALHHAALPGLRDLVRTPGFEDWWTRATGKVTQAS